MQASKPADSSPHLLWAVYPLNWLFVDVDLSVSRVAQVQQVRCSYGASQSVGWVSHTVWCKEQGGGAKSKPSLVRGGLQGNNSLARNRGGQGRAG